MMMVRRLRPNIAVAYAFTLILGSAAPTAAADEKKVNPGRPGATETTDVLARGQFQLEVGFSFDRDTERGETRKTSMLPTVLIRVGLIDRLELNLGADGLVVQSTTGVTDRHREAGTGDPVIGFRYRVADPSGLLPSAAILVSTSIPAAGDPFGRGHSDFRVALAASHSLVSDVSLDWTMSYSGPIGGDNDLDWQLSYATALGLDIDARLGVFVEIFGDVPSAAGPNGSVSVGAGIIRYLGPNMSADLSISVGLTGATEDLGFGLGFVIHL